MFRVTFGLKEMKKVRVAWQNKGQTKVTTAKDQKKVKGQMVEQSSPEENRRFSRHLMMEIEERQDGW